MVDKLAGSSPARGPKKLNNMSRSTQPFKGFFSDGWHIVSIMEAIIPASEPDGSILITFADGNNNKCQELYKMDKHFIKMCGDACIITPDSVFDSKKAIGARLQINIVEGMLGDTKEYNHPGQQIAKKVMDKVKIIAEQRKMIKKIESTKPDEFDM